MSSLTISPCQHHLSGDQLLQLSERRPLTLYFYESSKDFFNQLNCRVLKDVTAQCPTCSERIETISPVPGGDARFPLSKFSMKRIQVNMMRFELKSPAQEQGKRRYKWVRFGRVDLENIEDGGSHSVDQGRTYRALADLANDHQALIHSYGWLLGRILYYLPTRWKAKIYTDAIKKAQQKDRLCLNWVLALDGGWGQWGPTVGMINLEEIDNAKFQLTGDLANKRLLNFGAMLHSNFQRRGIITQLNDRLFKQLAAANTDIDGLWIATRPNNKVVNHIAQKLGFTFVKQMDVPHEDFLPIWGTVNIRQNLYVKLLQNEADPLVDCEAERP